jgi:hypothetical protein
MEVDGGVRGEGKWAMHHQHLLWKVSPLSSQLPICEMGTMKPTSNFAFLFFDGLFNLDALV